MTAEVTPIRSREDATNALAQTVMRMRVGWDELKPKDQTAVAQRYMRMGEAADSSLVKLEVPEAARQFDWDAFYAQVENYL